MKININQLKRSGYTSKDFELSYQPQQDLISLPGVKFDLPAKVSASLSIGNSTVAVQGKVSFSLSGECSKCLLPAQKEVTAEFSCDFSQFKSDDADFYIESGVLDLSLPVNETILINMPYTVHCSKLCRGLCAGCGANLNERVCDCENII